MPRHWMFRPDVIAFLLAALLFSAWPEIDLYLTSLFYQRGHYFFWDDAGFVRAVYKGTHLFAAIAALTAIAVLIQRRNDAPPSERDRRRAAAFFLCVMIIGPGLTINLLAKEHWGRARPADVAEFGGDHQFTPALIPTNQCRSNCSFMSGHASIGFLLFSFAFISPARRREWVLIALTAGSVIGLVRVAQGRHYPSDIIFSGFTVWWVTLGTAWAFRHKGWLPAWPWRREPLPAETA